MTTSIPYRLVHFLTDEYRTDYYGQIDTTRCKCALGIQYKHESKEDITGFISKPVARPEYRTIYQHKGMVLQNFTTGTYIFLSNCLIY